MSASARINAIRRKYFVEDVLDKDIVDSLARVGDKAIHSAVEEGGLMGKDPGNITGNQIDAFAWGVYFNGMLVRSGFIKDSWRLEHDSPTRKNKVTGQALSLYGAPPIKWHGKTLRGRAEAKKALRNFTPPHRGYTLFITNAMPYSIVQESRNLHVISQLFDYLYILKSKYSSKFTTIEFNLGSY